jgi:hypothetical protein
MKDRRYNPNDGYINLSKEGLYSVKWGKIEVLHLFYPL